MMRQPDWSLLPPELVQFISEKISCITDYIYLRAVCWGWRLASLPEPRHLPPQLPWLLLPITSIVDTVTEPEILFYDLYRSKLSTLHHPILQGSRISGSLHGWLILERGLDVILFNPVSRANIHVCSISGMPNIFPIPEKSKISPTDFTIEEDSVWSGMRKAILTSSPLDSGCMVVGLFELNWKIAFCRIGDQHWTLIEEYHHGGPLFRDIAWHHNLLHAIDVAGGVYIYDLCYPSKQYFDAHVEFTYINLVEGFSEPMALVQNFPKISYEVFKWRNEGQPTWHQVYDVGDDVLFLSDANCISIPFAYLQSNRLRDRQICSGKQDYSSILSIKLEELGNGDAEEIANLEGLEGLGRCYFETSFWLAPSYS